MRHLASVLATIVFCAGCGGQGPSNLLPKLVVVGGTEPEVEVKITAAIATAAGAVEGAKKLYDAEESARGLVKEIEAKEEKP